MRRPNPGRALASAGEWLRGAGGAGSSFLARIGRAIARVPRSIGQGVVGFWRGLSISARPRLVAALGVAIVLLLLFGLAVPNLPCRLPGGESCPPADDAEELVPADALAYVHMNLDPETEQYELAADVADRVPIFSDQAAARALALLPRAAGRPTDFERDLVPLVCRRGRDGGDRRHRASGASRAARGLGRGGRERVRDRDRGRCTRVRGLPGSGADRRPGAGSPARRWTASSRSGGRTASVP